LGLGLRIWGAGCRVEGLGGRIWTVELQLQPKAIRMDSMVNLMAIELALE